MKAVRNYSLLVVGVGIIVLALVALMVGNAPQRETKAIEGAICGDRVCEVELGENSSLCPEDCGISVSVHNVTVVLNGSVEGKIRVMLIDEHGGLITVKEEESSVFRFDGITADTVGVVVENPNNKRRIISSIGGIEGKSKITITLPDNFFSEEGNAELENNVFTDTIGIETEEAYKKEGYVIVRYFYNNNCHLCVSPVNWRNTLMDIAAEMKDVVVLEIFNSKTQDWAKKRWGMAGIDMPADPVIRIEGAPGGEQSYRVYYGVLLSNMYDLPKEKLIVEICKFTDKC